MIAEGRLACRWLVGGFLLVASGWAAGAAPEDVQQLPELGSPAWVALFCDRSGGAVTCWKEMAIACPNPACDHHRTANQGMWSAAAPEAFSCPACGSVFPGAAYPEEATLEACGQSFEYHTTPTGEKRFLTPALRYFKACHALSVAAGFAREAASPRLADDVRKASARKALDIMLAFSEMYIHTIHIARRSRISTAGWPNRCNWGRLDHFGDYVFPTMVCGVFDRIAATGIVSDAERAAYKRFVEYMLSHVTFAWYRQSGGMGNWSVQIRRDCWAAVKTFPDLEIHDLLHEQTRGTPRKLSGPDLLHEILEGPEGLFMLFGRYFYADGLMRERSPAYQEMLISHLRRFLPDIAAYTDPPSYEPPDPRWHRFEHLALEDNDVVKRCMTAHDALVLPDETVMPIGDSYYGITAPGAGGARESSLHPGWGVGALRCGRGPGATLAALNWGSTRDGHSHNDMLNVLFWGQGQLLVTDLGYVNDRHDLKGTWWRGAAMAHNTVVVDATNPPRTTAGELTAWAVTPRCSAVQARSRHTDPADQELRRTLVLVGGTEAAHGGGYVVDVFHVRGGGMHDYVLHAQAPIGQPEERLSLDGMTVEPCADPTASLLTLTPGADPKTAVGYEHITGLATGTAAGPYRATWHMGGDRDVAFTLHRLVATPETVFVGLAPGHRLGDPEPTKDRALHKLVCRRVGPPPLMSVFPSILESSSGGTRSIQGSRLLETTGTNASVAIEVTKPDGIDIVLVAAEPGVMSVPEKGITFDGRIALVTFERDGRRRSATVVEGDSLQVGTDVVAKNPPTLRGRTVGHPGGLAANILDEQPASIEIDIAVPPTAVGRSLFADHADGSHSGWIIHAATPVPGGGTRLVLDRPARVDVHLARGVTGDRTVLDVQGFVVQPGLWCLFDGQWLQIAKLESKEVAAAGTTVTQPVTKIRLSAAVAGTADLVDTPIVVTAFGPGDRITIPAIE